MSTPIPFYDYAPNADSIYIGILSNLKPAATQLIINCNSVKISTCIKLTLLDLSLKQVINIKYKSYTSNIRDTIIESGFNFKTYSPDGFEYYFLRILEKETSFPLRNYIKKINKDLPENYYCYKEILKGSNINNYFLKSWFFNFFQLIKLNNQGKNIAPHLKHTLESINKTLIHLLNNSPKKATIAIEKLGGNIFLLTNLNFKLVEQLTSSFNSLEDINTEFTNILDVFYLSDNKYIVSDIYDLFDSLIDKLKE